MTTRYIQPLIGGMLFGLMLTGATVASASQLGLTLSTEQTSVDSGAHFDNTLRYTCVGDDVCTDAVITDEIPAELSGSDDDVQVVGNAHTDSTAYDTNTRIATWNLISALQPGSTGEVQLGVRFPQGSTPNGTVASNQAEISATGIGAVQSESVAVTATAAANWTFSKAVLGVSSFAVDETYTYRLYITSASGTGLLNLDGAALTDTLPTGAEFVSASNGGTESGGIVTWSLGDLLSGTQTRSKSFVRYVQVRYPSTDFSVGDTVTNSASLSGTLPGGDAFNIDATDERTLAVEARRSPAKGRE